MFICGTLPHHLLNKFFISLKKWEPWQQVVMEERLSQRRRCTAHWCFECGLVGWILVDCKQNVVMQNRIIIQQSTSLSCWLRKEEKNGEESRREKEKKRRKQLLLTEMQLNRLSLSKTHMYFFIIFLLRRCCSFCQELFFVSFFLVPLGNIAHNFKS